MSVGSFIVDIGPLRKFPAFRRLWLGYVVSVLGSQLTVVAVAYQVYLITHSSLDVGLISLAQLGPGLIAPIFGGSIADAIDRRKLLLVMNAAAAICSLCLALNAMTSHPKLWPLFVFSAAGWGATSIDQPTRQAVMMTLVDRDSIVAAQVLRQVLSRIGLVAGPTVAGVIIAGFGLKVCYWVDVVSFASSTIAVLTLKASPPQGGATKFGLDSIKEGFRYLKGKRVIQACFLADMNATIFGLPVSLFPAIALTRFHGGARTVGFLYSAPGIGALCGAFLSGWTARIHRQGRAVLIAITIWGFAFVGFGLAPWLPLAMAFLVIAGSSDVVSAIFRNTIIQTEIPDRVRGRISSVQSAVVTSGPRLGNTEAGVVAQFAGVEFSVVSGAVACLIGIALIAKFLPGLAHYQRNTDMETVAESPPTGQGVSPP